MTSVMESGGRERSPGDGWSRKLRLEGREAATRAENEESGEGLHVCEEQKEARSRSGLRRKQIWFKRP